MFKLFAFALFALFAISMVNSAPIPRGSDLHKPDCESGVNPSFTSSPAPGPTPVPSSGDDFSEDDDNDDGDDDCEDEPSSSPASSPTPYESPEPTPTPTPTPSSTDGAAPSPSPTPDTSSDSNSSDSNSSDSNSNSSGSDTHTGGDLTWFTQNGVAGACGQVHSDTDFIAALDTSVYGDTSVQSSYCGKTIRITWEGNSVDVVVADACPTCDNASSVDLSQAAFQALAPLSTGLLTGASWSVV